MKSVLTWDSLWTGEKADDRDERRNRYRKKAVGRMGKLLSYESIWKDGEKRVNGDGQAEL